MPVPSYGVALGLVIAGQGGFGGRGRLARPGGIWGRWHVVWFWLAGHPIEGSDRDAINDGMSLEIGDRVVATARFSRYAAADALVRHAGVAKVALSGSTATGEHVHEVTSADFKHLTLELGGKSPTIICGGADPGAAAPGIVAASWAVLVRPASPGRSPDVLQPATATTAGS